MKVYVVTMTRWGDPEGHTYVHAVCASEVVAEAQGMLHKQERAGKYEYEIKPLEILTHPQNMGDETPEEVKAYLEKAEEIVRYRNTIRNAIKDFGKVYEPTLLPRQGKEEVVDCDQELSVLEAHPTSKELTVIHRKLLKEKLRCAICPPNKKHNSKRKPKHGTKKPKYKDKRR